MKKHFESELLHLDWGFIDQENDPQIITGLMESALREFGYDLLQYGNPQGFPRLKEALRKFIQDQLTNADFQTEEMCITNGATGGLDLLGRILLKGKYDSVVFEPSFDTALESLKINSRKVHGIPMNPFSQTGFLSDEEWAALEKALSADKSKIFYVNPTFHNPTGITIPHADRVRILELCSKHGVTLVEDDPYRLYDYSQEGVPDSFLDLDKDKESVIHINSFSKLFFPGVRIGYMIAKKDLIQQITHVQKYTTSSPNLLTQGVCLKAIEQGQLPLIVATHTATIKNKMAKCLQCIEETGIEKYVDLVKPAGGFFIWGKTHSKSADTKELQTACLSKGVSFVPGNIYFLKEDNRMHFRLACSQIRYEDIERAITLLGKGMEEYLS